MQVSNRTVAASAIGAGLAVAATQNAAISLTGPIPIPSSVMTWLLPIVMAIVPILLSNFAPGLLPLWEWIKGKLPLPAELAEYKRAIGYANDDPKCPIMHRKAKSIIEAAFEKHHPDPAPPILITVPGVPNEE